MLKPAGLYADQLKQRFAEIAFDENYIYMRMNSYRDAYVVSDSTWNKHEFASVNSRGKVIGYFAYAINRDAFFTNEFQAINFEQHGSCILFGRDLIRVISDIFLRFGFRKLTFSVAIGNPAEAMYDRYIERIGGRIIGVFKEENRLQNGSFCDEKYYEILARDFIQSKEVLRAHSKSASS